MPLRGDRVEGNGEACAAVPIASPSRAIALRLRARGLHGATPGALAETSHAIAGRRLVLAQAYAESRTAMTETELTFALRRSELHKLQRRLRAVAERGRGATTQLTSSYFDTPDLRLKKADLVLPRAAHARARRGEPRLRERVPRFCATDPF